MRILIDLQPLQTPGAAKRGVGKYTNGLLSALASSHEVIGMRRNSPFLVPPSAEVPTVEFQAGVPKADLEREVSGLGVDVVVNCSGPYWDENLIVSDLSDVDRPIIASIFYDVIPWVFPDVYLGDPGFRSRYHNRCVDLYAHADLVCGISRHSSSDAIRFGYATAGSVTTISTGLVPLAPEETNASERWGIPRPYLLSVSGDEFRKNSETLIKAFLQSDLGRLRSLVIVISNDRQTGFSSRMGAKYDNLRAQGVVILPEVTDGELGALYRDSEAFVFTSSYEGFGIPIVEAMQFGKWIISPQSSSLAEVTGPALLSPIADPRDVGSIVGALNQAGEGLDKGPLDETVPLGQAKHFTWAEVRRNFDQAVTCCREVPRSKPSGKAAQRLRLFWASPFPADVSGIGFYSEDLVEPVSRHYDVVLVPNTISTFVPTPKTGRFKIVEPTAPAVLAMAQGEPPLVFYNIGNSHFHVDLLDLLFAIPGIVLLHDSFVLGLEGLWRERRARLLKSGDSSPVRAVGARLGRLCSALGKVDRLLHPVQPTRFRRMMRVIARFPGVHPMVLALASAFRSVSAMGNTTRVQRHGRLKGDRRPLDVQIIESSRVLLFLCEHARLLIPPEHLARRPAHVVPLYARYRGKVSAERRAGLRLKYAIPDEAFVVTTTGFQARIKLTDRVIESCIELQRPESNAVVYVQVLGEFVDPVFEAEVSALVERGGVRAFISHGFLDEEILRERVALSDVAVFLRASSTGGPSAGLNDALGMGVPSIVTDDFAFREYPEKAVLRVANSEVTEGLLLLFRHAEVRGLLATEGLRYAEDVSPERVAARLCEAFSLYEHGPSTGWPAWHASAPVLVDITYALMHKMRSGLQRVEREIAAGLRELDPGSQYFTFVGWDRNSRQFHIVSPDLLKWRDDLPPAETWLSACPSADIRNGRDFFVLSFNWPLGDAYFADLLSLVRGGLRLSVLIPDLIPLRHRWGFFAHHPEGTTIDQLKKFCLQIIPVCTNVLTISDYSRADIQKLLAEIGSTAPYGAPDLHVLTLGSNWAVPFVEGKTDGLVMRRAQRVERPYILYVSTLELRKNHERLFEAFARVRRRISNLDLVLVGRVDGSISDTTLEFIRQSAWIHHFERVDDATLKQLYGGCMFTVYPSIEEGYGLPVIESFTHGKFCIAARAGGIPEAGGVFADYFDPCDVQMLADKILKYVTNPLELATREALLSSWKPTSWRDSVWQVARIFYGDEVEHLFGARRES